MSNNNSYKSCIVCGANVAWSGKERRNMPMPRMTTKWECTKCYGIHRMCGQCLVKPETPKLHCNYKWPALTTTVNEINL